MKPTQLLEEFKLSAKLACSQKGRRQWHTKGDVKAFWVVCVVFLHLVRKLAHAGEGDAHPLNIHSPPPQVIFPLQNVNTFHLGIALEFQ